MLTLKRRHTTCEEAVLIKMDQSAASTSAARKRQHYARPGHVSFDERSHKLATLAVESFGRLGVEGSKFIDQLAASVVGGQGRWVDGKGRSGE